MALIGYDITKLGWYSNVYSKVLYEAFTSSCVIILLLAKVFIRLLVFLHYLPTVQYIFAKPYTDEKTFLSVRLPPVSHDPLPRSSW